jgi:tetratricopeptide (TPR) repeat protein
MDQNMDRNMDQNTESFQRIEAIFHQALATPPEARAQLIQAQCGGDRELAWEVNLLLEACEAEQHATAAHAAPSLLASVPAVLSDRIGPYLLDRLLGRGGMGAVYLAHRADGQFDQQVAIKLIDLPLATDLFRERFRQERQILAGLQHPYIARLLDGGVSQHGDLYLVMEYVDGVPIHRYCDEHQLNQTQRLQLFLHVCEAVQFAHQNLVVHRDLKPDNIFVAADSTPRLLDFGTAKLLSSSPASLDGQLTREGQQSFTPLYASPEQVLGNPITTASDTYSLGVLLYLLLTGQHPYELTELTTGEMISVICQEPPRRPSHAIGATRPLDHDLEAILLKSLRKEPHDRYRTAEQLAADIRAFLEGQPVAARRGTLRYRAAKFIRRHRFGIAAAVLVAVLLVAGIAGILWQSRVANLERRRAEARSADLRQLSNSLMSELDEAIKQLPGSTGVQKLLVTRVLEHLDRMASDSQGDRLTQLDLVDAYARLGNLQGNPYEQNLGDPDGALVSIDRAIAIGLPLVPPDSKDRDALRALAFAQQSRSEVLFGAARTPEAIVSMRQAVANWDRAIALPNLTPAFICEVAAAHGSLADQLGQSGTSSLANSAAALEQLRASISLDERALAIDPNFIRAQRGLAIMRMKIGSIEMDTDPAQALKDFEISRQRSEALPAKEQSSLLTIRMHGMIVRKEAGALAELGQTAKASELYDKIIALEQSLADQDPQDLRALADLQVVLTDKAVILQEAADPALGAPQTERTRSLAQAAELWSRVAAVMQKMLKQDPTNENWKMVQADAQIRLGAIQAQLHPSASAQFIADSKSGLADLRALAAKPQASAMVLDMAATDFLLAQPPALRDPDFSITCSQRAVQISHRTKPDQLLTLAQGYRAANQPEKARATATEALALLAPLQPNTPKSNLRKLLEAEARPSR